MAPAAPPIAPIPPATNGFDPISLNVLNGLRLSSPVALIPNILSIICGTFLANVNIPRTKKI